MLEIKEKIGKLGFGLMRLPMNGEEVDIEQTKQMVDLFLENGFTYFDTAYGYINGKSEEAAKTAIVDRYPRDKFQLATKLPAWAGPKTEKEAKDMFWTSLKRTGVDYFDFYLLHNLGGKRTKFFDDFGIWDFVLEQKAQGRIKHIGFSMHAKADYLDELLTKHPEMEFVQLQINYADWDSATVEAGKCYEVARKHGKPVVIMEPVKGGALANLPEPVAKVFDAANANASYSSWAIRYAASLEGVLTVLSGMSTLDQVKDNVSYMRDFKPLTNEEKAVVVNAQAELAKIPTIPCTDCQYCVEGCPQNIPIPGVFSAMNSYKIFADIKRSKGSYTFATRNSGKASECVECGACEGVCPQSIEIIKELKDCASVLEG